MCVIIKYYVWSFYILKLSQLNVHSLTSYLRLILYVQ